MSTPMHPNSFGLYGDSLWRFRATLETLDLWQHKGSGGTEQTKAQVFNEQVRRTSKARYALIGPIHRLEMFHCSEVKLHTKDHTTLLMFHDARHLMSMSDTARGWVEYHSSLDAILAAVTILDSTGARR